MITDAGTKARLILGQAYGEQSPVTMQSETFYLEVIVQPGAHFPLPDDHEHHWLKATEGAVEIAGDLFDAGRMMVFRPGDPISVQAGSRGARDGAGRRDHEWER